MNGTAEYMGVVQQVAELSALAAIGVAGLLGNLITIIVSTCVIKTHRPIHYIIIGLAFVDFLTSAFCVPFCMYLVLDMEMDFSPALCLFFRTVYSFKLGAASFSNMTIAMNRHFLTGPPRLYARLFSKRNTILFIFGNFGITFLLVYLPAFYMVGVNKNLSQFGLHCDSTPLNNISYEDIEYLIYTWVIAIFLYVIPLTVTLSCYCKIYTKLRFLRDIGRTIKVKKDGDQVFKQHQALKESTITMLLVFGTFFLCFTPWLAAVLMEPLYKISIRVVQRVLIYILLSNSMINPFIYAGRSAEFRENLQVNCRCNRSPEEKEADIPGELSSVYKLDFEGLKEDFTGTIIGRSGPAKAGHM